MRGGGGGGGEICSFGTQHNFSLIIECYYVTGCPVAVERT